MRKNSIFKLINTFARENYVTQKDNLLHHLERTRVIFGQFYLASTELSTAPALGLYNMLRFPPASSGFPPLQPAFFPTVKELPYLVAIPPPGLLNLMKMSSPSSSSLSSHLLLILYSIVTFFSSSRTFSKSWLFKYDRGGDVKEEGEMQAFMVTIHYSFHRENMQG